MRLVAAAILVILCATSAAVAQERLLCTVGEWKPLKLSYVAKRPYFDSYTSAQLSAAVNTLQDVGQTNQFSAFGFKELNLLVKHLVDTKQLWAYNLVTGAACYGLWRLIESIPDKRTREAVYWLWTLVEGFFVYHNIGAVKAPGFPLIVTVVKWR